MYIIYIYIYIYIYYIYIYIIKCKKLSVYHINHVPKCLSCHRAKTGRAHCFHDYKCVIDISYNLCNLSNFKREVFFGSNSYENQT